MNRVVVALSVLAIFSSPVYAHKEGTSLAVANPDKMICVDEDTTGSRLQTVRHCMTQAQWNTYRGEVRDTMDRMERFGIQGDGPEVPGLTPR